MALDLWVIAPVTAALCTLGSGLAAVSRSGAPPGRTVYFALSLAIAAELVWLAAFHAQLQGTPMLSLSAIASMSSVGLCPLLVAFGVRFGQRLGHSVGGLAPLLLSVLIGLVLLYWGANGRGIEILESESGEPLIGLTPGASRATAMALLLAGCFGVVRFQALMEAARRAGVESLSRAALGPLLGYVILVLVTSQFLLYGLCSTRLLAVGSLALVPVSLSLIPVFGRNVTPPPVLPSSSRLVGSTLLLLVLGLFLVGLAAFGEVIDQFFPSRNLLWYRWGGTVLVIIIAALSVVPSVRRPLSEYFDRNLYPHRWDFRKEWARANAALGPVESRSVLLSRIRGFLEETLGPTGVGLWVRARGGDRMEAVEETGLALPPLDPDNPLRRALDQGGPLLQFDHRARRLEDLPPIVENLDLIEGKGFRIFLSIRANREELGVLGIAPASMPRLDADHKHLLQNFASQLAHVLWMLRRIERPGPASAAEATRPGAAGAGAAPIPQDAPLWRKHGVDSS